MSRSPLTEVVEAPGEHTASELLSAHTAQLASVIDTVGADEAARAAGLSADEVEAVAAGDAQAAGALDLRAVAVVLALADGAPPPADIVRDALDDLLFGMTTGVLDVDTVAGELELDLEPREVQGILEGRHPATLREYAGLQAVIAGRAG